MYKINKKNNFPLYIFSCCLSRFVRISNFSVVVVALSCVLGKYSPSMPPNSSHYHFEIKPINRNPILIHRFIQSEFNTKPKFSRRSPRFYDVIFQWKSKQIASEFRKFFLHWKRNYCSYAKGKADRQSRREKSRRQI